MESFILGFLSFFDICFSLLKIVDKNFWSFLFLFLLFA